MRIRKVSQSIPIKAKVVNSYSESEEETYSCDYINKKIVDAVYPVGSIYMSVNSTNPTNLFGGTWEQIKDKFLLSTGNSYANGSTGGSATHTIAVENLPAHTHTYSNATAVQGHTLTISEIPSHNHSFGTVWKQDGGYGSVNTYAVDAANRCNIVNSGVNTGGGQAHSHGLTKANANTGSTGSGTALNTMPPYLAVYMWKRIS